MRQISDVRPGPLDNLPVGLAFERSDLLGEFPGQTLGTARSNGGEPIGDALERRKAEADLECRREKQDCRKNGKCDDQRLVERARFVRNFSGIARYGDKIVPLVAQIDIALDKTQALIFRPADVAGARAVRTARNALVPKVRQAAVPQRTRRSNFSLARINARHLPVPAGQWQLEQRFTQGLREFFSSFFWRRDVG